MEYARGTWAGNQELVSSAGPHYAIVFMIYYVTSACRINLTQPGKEGEWVRDGFGEVVTGFLLNLEF